MNRPSAAAWLALPLAGAPGAGLGGGALLQATSAHDGMSPGGVRVGSQRVLPGLSARR